MRNKVIVLLCFLGLSAIAFTQKTDSTTLNIRDTIRIYYDVDLKVDTAQRVYRLQPQDVRSRATSITPRKYASKSFEVALGNENPKVKIYPVKTNKQEQFTGGLVKLGYGVLYNTPYIEGFYNSTRKKEMSYGVYYHHMSSTKGSVDDKNSQQSTNDLQVYGKKFFKTSTLSSSLGYRRDRYNYYGYGRVLNLDDGKGVRDSLKQVYNKIAFQAALQSVNENSKLQYNLPFVFSAVSSTNVSKEMVLGSGSTFSYKLSKEAKVNLPVDFYFMNYTNASSENGRVFFSLKPTYRKTIGKWAYEGGFNLTVDNDDYEGAKAFHLYPILRASYTLNELKGTIAFAGVEGTMNRKDYTQTVQENPFVGDSTSIRNENVKIDLYAGLKGNLLEKLSYRLKTGFKQVDNLMLYMNDSLVPSAFDANYDEKAVGVFSLEASLVYSKFKKFDFGLNIGLNSYSTSSYDEAYHLPSFTTDFLTKYKVFDNFNLTMDVYYISGLYAYDYSSSNSVELDPVFDISFGAEYYLNKKWSLYGDFNNLLNQDYSRYWQYPLKRFNFILGLTYAF